MEVNKNIDVSNNKIIYKSLIKKRILIINIIIILLLLLFLLNISVGSTSISIKEILKAIFINEGEGNNILIIRKIRLPMSLMAIVVGFSLGIGGCEIQTILTGNSFFFTFLISTMIYLFSSQREIGKTAIILFGIALNFLFTSFTMILEYVADEDKLQNLIFWNFGSLLKTTWTKLLIVLITLVVCIIFLYKNSWKLTAMTLGDAKAESIGVNPYKLRKQILFFLLLLLVLLEQ